MNRPIKFRAWDKENKALFYQDKQGSEEADAICRWLLSYPEEYEVMQFTGLLDKNGKEIYEGDILIIDNDLGRGGLAYPVLIEWCEYTGFRRHCKGECKAQLMLTQNDMGKSDHKNGFKIIGNIYENPKLFEL